MKNLRKFLQTDITDKNAWQLNLYRKIGKSQMRGKDEMSQEAVVEKIANMGQVVAILHTVGVEGGHTFRCFPFSHIFRSRAYLHSRSTRPMNPGIGRSEFTVV